MIDFYVSDIQHRAKVLPV